MVQISISEQNLTSVLSGASVIDLVALEIQSLEQAYSFINSYGYDLHKSEDLEELWSIHRKSVSFLREHLINENETIPESLSDPAILSDLGYLILKAGSKENKEEQRWACAILKVMHSYAHVDNDLFSQFSDQIQDQVLKKLRNHISEDPVMGFRVGSTTDGVSLHKFEIKPFKRTSSSVLKFLSKKQAIALTLLDRLGIRFVTKNYLDAFRVIDYLVKENVISFPNVMPNQSNNTLYPVNLFLEVLKESPAQNFDEINRRVNEKIIQSEDRAEFNVKGNEFSGENYKFMKFICRQLIEIDFGGKMIHFFFPYEIQIVDYETYIKNLSGPQAHEEYKKRQKQAARLRVFGRA